MNYKATQKKLAPVLAPLGKLYASIMHLRASAYKKGIKKSQQPKAFCVAVGNISWGGSGKTPLSDWLLTWGKKQGLITALLTRGYGGKSEKRPLIVKPHSDPSESGDEPLMLANMHPESYILADPKRRRALDWLETNTTANFIVLDDAMQHLAVKRDLNLVLLRAKDLDEQHWEKVIPAGEWREGASALQRASAFLLRIDPEDFTKNIELIKKRLQNLNKPIFSFYLKPSALRPMHTTAITLPHLEGRPYLLCTGVGSPEDVQKSATQLLNMPAHKNVIYPDHYRFSMADIKQLTKYNLPIITTAKDAVKIKPFIHSFKKTEFYILESDVVFGDSLLATSNFADWLYECWHRLN